jgi:16S rRNA (guanine966-N2)-methyltransferase
MSMRIIAGSARGVPLRVPQGWAVRPTGARVRTSLFSILGETVEGARVADLFAGCGALGLEALSRGAAFGCFVESARDALAALGANLAKTRLAERAEVVRADAFSAVPELVARAPFQLVLSDPPYEVLRQAPARFLALLEELAASGALDPAALVVVQHDSRTVLPDAVGPLRVTDRRVYAATTLTMLERG